MDKKISRRTFHKIGTASALAFGAAAVQTENSKARILGANDRIRCAFIGVANRGRQLISAFEKSPEMEIAVLCDIDTVPLEMAWEKAGQKPEKEHDFRKLLDRDDIDAFVLATPDHWHAWQTIEACKAGKDVYCEKPLAATVHEGRLMVEAARKYKRIVQVGIHRRSGPIYQKLAAEGLDNKLGKVVVSRCSHTSNMYPKGIGHAKPAAPPANLDWDLWVGPRAEQAYQENIAPYKFRWWRNYSSQVANQGVHFIDLIRWYYNEDAPISVCAMGGKYVVDDDRTIPDTLNVCFEFASGRLLLFNHFESSGNPIMATDENYRPLGFLEFRGVNGTLYAYDNRYIVKPERPGQFQDKGERMKEETWTTDGSAEGNTDITALHAKNFLDCMRSRQTPNGDVEIGHRSTSMSLIANISLATGKRLQWDAKEEKFTNDDEANKLLSYEYRAPWKLEV